MVGKHGENKKREAKVSEKSQDSQSDGKPGSLGVVGSEGSIAGDDQIRFSRDASDKGVKERTLGGILCQLKQSMEAHLAYVDAHTERLKARLAEDDRQRSKLLADMAALEEELKQLENREEESN